MRTSTLSMLLAAALSGGLSAQVAEGEPAPEFEIKDSLHESVTDFASMRGKVLLLDFFATW